MATRKQYLEYMTREQYEALCHYAIKHGRTWKSSLRREWMNGTAGEVLHGLRNWLWFGPQGLVDFDLNTKPDSMTGKVQP